MRDAGMPTNANSWIRPCRIRHMASRMRACSVTRNEQRLVASTQQPVQGARAGTGCLNSFKDSLHRWLE